jgi:hypothetical protein
MLSEALQRNAEHEARLSNISDYAFEPRQQGFEILLPRLRDQDDRLREA